MPLDEVDSPPVDVGHGAVSIPSPIMLTGVIIPLAAVGNPTQNVNFPDLLPPGQGKTTDMYGDGWEKVLEMEMPDDHEWDAFMRDSGDGLMAALGQF